MQGDKDFEEEDENNLEEGVKMVRDLQEVKKTMNEI